jgi:hypothetical protein
MQTIQSTGALIRALERSAQVCAAHVFEGIMMGTKDRLSSRETHRYPHPDCQGSRPTL